MAEIIAEPTVLSKVIALKFKINDVDVPKTTQLPTNKQFNTTDTDAWFTFELDGLASTNGTYDLTLINLDDKSIFHHANVLFQALPFHYKLNSSEDVTLNEIRHAGRWLGQLVVSLSNGDTTARQFGFNIAGHILDGQDAQVVLLSDYQTLINTINLAKDDLAQYNVDYAALIADVTTAEGLREQAEIDRAAVFATLVESEMVAQNVATKLAEKEATFAPRMLSVEQQLAETLEKRSDHYYVGATQKYTTITSAFNQWVADGKPLAIIHIGAGEYNEAITGGPSCNLTFLGENKETTIWRSTSGYYPDAPFTGGGGLDGLYFKNLTVIADHPEGWTSTTGGAYALHIDYPGSVGKTVIDNCDLHSYQDSALGCGTGLNQQIYVKNANLYHYADFATSGANGVNHGALLYHTSATPNSANQKIHFENVYAWSLNGPGVQILSSANGNVLVPATFINVTARSDFYENYNAGQYKESRVVLSNPNNMITITEDSKLNNSSKLNPVVATGTLPYRTQYQRVLRDLSLTDDLVVPYWTQYEIDYIEVKGYIESKNAWCNGWYYKVSGTKYLVYRDEAAVGNYIMSDPVTAKFIGFSKDSLANRVFGDVKSIADGNITLSWSIIGAGMTGQAQLMFIIHYK